MSARGRAGELLVSIGHQPGAVDKLTVVVLKARNLPSNSDVINGCPGYSLTGARRFCRLNQTSRKRIVRILFFLNMSSFRNKLPTYA